jgi:hypothetical protein
MHRLRNQEKRGVPSWVLFAFVFAVLPNLPFQIAGHKWGFLRDGWFCLEYAVGAIVALFLPRVLASAMLIALMAADLICGVCRNYYLSPMECFYGIAFVRSLPAQSRLYAIAVVGSVLLIAVAAAFVGPHSPNRRERLQVTTAVLALIVVCLTVDGARAFVVTGKMPPLAGQVDVRPSAYFSMRLSRISLMRLATFARIHADLRDSERAGSLSLRYAPSATRIALEKAGVGQGSDHPNVVLVLLESWGLTDDQAVADAIESPYETGALADRYAFVKGVVPFYGATIAGEARELCGSTIGYHMLDAPSPELDTCVPHKLASMGYTTLAVHGLDGHMFSRQSWYPRIGFQQTVFRPQFKQQRLPDCSEAFVGICDASIADWISARLANARSPTFVHWMTLNSHLPVVTPTPLGKDFPCQFDSSLRSSPAFCSWYQLVANVHRAVAQMASASLNLNRKTAFIVVGDHMPPFSNPRLRSRFSLSDVPYIILLPRDLQETALHSQNIRGNGTQPLSIKGNRLPSAHKLHAHGKASS